jgi:hypothetical protein
MGILPAMHGYFHEGAGPSGAKPVIGCIATAVPGALPTGHDSDQCPICCLLHGGAAPAEAPTLLDASAPITRAVFTEQCSVVSFLPLASRPPRAPPA